MSPTTSNSSSRRTGASKVQCRGTPMARAIIVRAPVDAPGPGGRGKSRTLAVQIPKETAPATAEGDGTVQARIAQQPETIGTDGVQQALKALKGGQNEAKIATGFTVITKGNIDSPKGKAAADKASC